MVFAERAKMRRVLVADPAAVKKATYLVARVEARTWTSAPETRLAWRTARYAVARPADQLLCDAVQYLLRDVARRSVSDIRPATARSGSSAAVFLQQAMEMVWLEDLSAFGHQDRDWIRSNLDTVRWCFMHLYRVLRFAGLSTKSDVLQRYWSLCEHHARTTSDLVVYDRSLFEQVGHTVVFTALRTAEKLGFLPPSSPFFKAGPAVHNRFLSRKLLNGLSALKPSQTEPGKSVYAHLAYGHLHCTLSNGQILSGSRLVSAFVDAHFQRASTPLVTIGPGDRRRAFDALRRLGIDPERKIVTLHVREGGFETTSRKSTETRNAGIRSYLPAIRSLIARGYQVVRLGDPTMRRLEPLDGYFDYPFSAIKSDRLDVILASICDFHIGTSSGMSHVPLLFDRPVLYTNWMPFGEFIHSRKTLTLTKTLRERNGRRVPLSEANTRFRNLYDGTVFRLLDIAVLDNTPGEIREAVDMMIGNVARPVDRRAPLRIRFVPPPGAAAAAAAAP